MSQDRPTSGRRPDRTSSQTRRPLRTSRLPRRGRPAIRLRIGFILMAVVLSFLGARLVQLQGFGSERYARLAAAEATRKLVLPAERGDILDRNGEPFADSVDGRSVIANPQETAENAQSIARLLSNRLGVDYTDTLAALRKTGGNRQYAYLARQVPATTAEEVVSELEAKGFKGVFTESEPLRVYPSGTLAANLVGFMGIDTPAGGFERTFDKELAGTDGFTSYQTGSGYRIPLGKSTVRQAQDGASLRTTLDAPLQSVAQEALARAVKDSNSLSGTAVVMSTKTGDVLALADYPTYDASNPLASDEDNFQPRSLTEPYEPGSVEKVLTTAALLDAGKVTPRTPILVPPLLRRQDRPIGDWFDHGTLKLTMAGVLAKSSNIGTVLAADKLSPAQLMGYLEQFGMGSRTNVGFPGESPGIVPQGAGLTSQVKDRITFGQSIAVNAVQMTSALNAVANKGTYVSPSFVQGSATMSNGVTVGTDHTVTRRVVSEKAARQTALMMEKVVNPDGGEPAKAAVAGYRVSGKTGTAQRVDPACKCYRGVSVSFGGFAPADDPQITVYVVLHRPADGSTGGGTAGPVFSRVMGYALNRFDVVPTDTTAPKMPIEW